MLQNLPDLTYMRAQVLMFPIPGKDHETKIGHVTTTTETHDKSGNTEGGGGAQEAADTSMIKTTTIPTGIRTISYS